MSQKRVFNQIETTVDFLIITLLGYYASSSQNPGGEISPLSLPPPPPLFPRNHDKLRLERKAPQSPKIEKEVMGVKKRVQSNKK
jgi:hypothetical protein